LEVPIQPRSRHSSLGDVVSWHPYMRGRDSKASEAGSVGVAGSQRTAEYPLNLQGASCPTLARWPLPTGRQERRTGPPSCGFMSLPGPRFTPFYRLRLGPLSSPYSGSRTHYQRVREGSWRRLKVSRGLLYVSAYLLFVGAIREPDFCRGGLVSFACCCRLS